MERGILPQSLQFLYTEGVRNAIKTVPDIDPPSLRGYPSPIALAIVAQLVEHLVVVQEVAGSSPVGRPSFTPRVPAG